VLCANAGIFPSAKFEEMTPDALDEVLDTNLRHLHRGEGVPACAYS
jgi:NAD(P)-dependent dehydrogenase (short-subunit alcohol dehydrogenase family)